MDAGALRDRLAQACRVLGRLDLTKAATGHASVRKPGGDTFLVRARGPHELGVRYTGPDQIIEVDLDGRPVDADAEGLKAPLEIHIHAALYRARPEVGSVVHMHPPLVVACTISGVALQPIYGAYDPRSAQMAMDGIPTYPRSILIDTPQLGADLASAMGHSTACLMHGHGVTTAAGTIEDAALNMILVNELAAMTYHASVLGTPQPIPDEDQRVIGELERPASGGFDPQLSPRAAALWRYYCALTDA